MNEKIRQNFPLFCLAVLGLIAGTSLIYFHPLNKAKTNVLRTIFQNTAPPKKSGFTDIREPLARGYLYVNPTVDTYPGISGYGFTFGFDINLVSTAKLPESSAITEWIWGFNLGPGKDYRFIINSVPCQLIDKDSIPTMLGNMKDSYEIGKIYNPTFAGLRKPFDPTKIPQGDCTQVWGELQPDPAGVTKLENFFRYGDSGNLPVIQIDGHKVIDLRKAVILTQISD